MKTVSPYQRMLEVDFHRRHRVRWIEADASGFVQFPNYIRMMEETEYEFLRSLGLAVVMEDERSAIGFPRVSAEIEILTPAEYDDELEIWLQVSKNNGVKIEYRFEIDRGGEVIATGTFAVACCRFPPGKPPCPILIPGFFLDRFVGERGRDQEF